MLDSVSRRSAGCQKTLNRVSFARSNVLVYMTKRFFTVAVAGAVVGLSWVQTWATPCGSIEGSIDCCCAEPAPEIESCCSTETGPASTSEDHSTDCDCVISNVDGTVPQAVRLVDGASASQFKYLLASLPLQGLLSDPPALSMHTLHSAAGPPGQSVSIAHLHCSYQL